MDDNEFSIHVCKSLQDIKATKDEMNIIVEGLGTNITKHTGDIELERSMRAFIRNKQNQVVGGVQFHTFGGWVFTSLLWVEESLRNQGLGTRLMNIVEDEAKRLGCKYAHLDTYSFEAKPFYEKLGYEVFAVLDDYPKGHSKYFLKKTLEV